MNGFFSFLLHTIFIGTFVFLYIVTILILKPFRIHKRRPVSTVIYKLSYLAYLLVFIVLAYLALFFSGGPGNFSEIAFDKQYHIFIIIVLIAFIIPNIAIMLRRKVKDLRILYNYAFSVVNFIITLSLFYLIYLVKWEFT